VAILVICRCRPHVTGRMCEQPEQSYFTGLLDYLVYEAELANCSEVRTSESLKVLQKIAHIRSKV
jgi:hypothetical protein